MPPPGPCPKLNAPKQLALAPAIQHVDKAVPEAQVEQIDILASDSSDQSEQKDEGKVGNAAETKEHEAGPGPGPGPGPENTAQPINGDLNFTPSRHTAAVCRVAFSRDGNTVYSASKDRTVCEWDPYTKEIRRTIKHQVCRVAGVALSTENGSAAWALLGNKVEIHDVKDATPCSVPRTHAAQSWISAVSFSYDNRYLAYGSDDKFVRILDTRTNELKWKGKKHSGYISCIAFSTSGSRIASGSVDLSIQIWDMETGYGVGTLNARDGCARAVAFSPDASVVAAACGNTVCLWNLQQLKVSMRLQSHHDSVNTLAFSPSGRHLASGSADRTIILWDAVSGHLVWQISAHSGEILSICFAPDGKMIASGSEDCTVKMWPVADADCEGAQNGVTLAEEQGVIAPEEEKGLPNAGKTSSTNVSTRRSSKAEESVIYSSLAAAGVSSSEVRRCYLCLGYRDGRNTSERCVCFR